MINFNTILNLSEKNLGSVYILKIFQKSSYLCFVNFTAITLLQLKAAFTTLFVVQYYLLVVSSLEILSINQ